MARAPEFDLAKELGKPSFTPAQRDAPALVELVIADHDKAAAAVAALGEAGRRALEARLAPIAAGAAAPGDAARAGDLEEAARARIVAALGLLARAGDAAARATVLARLADPGVRVRRAAIAALGKLSPLAATEPGAVAEARAALLSRWDAGDASADEKRTLVEALGKLGGPEVRARLATLAPGDDAELARRRDRARLMADRDAGRAAPSAIVTSVGGLGRWPVRLHCKAGLGPLLAEEVAALGLRITARDDAWLETRCERYEELYRARLWSHAGVRVPLARVEARDEAAAIVAALTSPDVRSLLRAMTAGAIRWRLGVPTGHRRALVWRVARDVTAIAPELVNDPSQTTWDVLLDDGDARAAAVLELVPRQAADPRFAWRVAEVPAASHPTVAAALAFAAGAHAGDRVWDPFCGSGAELVERARLGPCTLLGTDVDATALAAARQNLAAAGVTATLALADARTHAPGSQDLVITNPPLGSRVQVDAAALLGAALPGLARALAPNGRLVWITPASRKTTPVAEQLGLRKTRDLSIDLGGVRGRLERWER